jgi:HK97 family phage major capsid protein
MSHRWLRAAYKKDYQTLQYIERSEAYGGSRQQGTDTNDGGEFLPSPLANFIATGRDGRERVAPNSMTVTSVSQTLDIPTETTPGAVGPAAENTAITPTNSTYGQLNLKKEKQGRFTLVSWELMNDESASFSIVNIIGNEAARKLAVAWDTASADGGVGTGTTAANSIATQAELTDAGNVGALDRAGVVKLLLTIDASWRDGGGVALMGNSAVTLILSQIVDANERPVWSFANDPMIPVGDITNTTGRVEGQPYLEIPFADPNLYVGNLRDAFAVLTDGGLRIDTSSDYAFNADQIAVRVLERRSSGVMQSAAFAFSVTS